MVGDHSGPRPWAEEVSDNGHHSGTRSRRRTSTHSSLISRAIRVDVPHSRPNFRRRGIRIDCILLAAGLIAVLEFKRSKLTPADRDQVTNYCVNLVEFHREARRLCENEGCIVVPILVMTEGRLQASAPRSEEFHAIRGPRCCAIQVAAIGMDSVLR
jgi:hypothetical protein